MKDLMTGQDTSKVPAVRSYLTLRKAIGIVGFGLPVVLIIGTWLPQGEFPRIENSISGYYCTGMRDVLVGSLCAIGVFLWSYKGYDNPDWRLPSEWAPTWLRRITRVTDNRASNVAGASAIGVALFPTPCDFGIGLLHVVFAALFLISLAFISLRLFTMHDPEKEGPTREQQRRNPIYRACGWTILACLALIAGIWFLPGGSFVWQLHPFFWLEWGAIWAFSISWFTKGKGLDRVLLSGEGETGGPKASY